MARSKRPLLTVVGKRRITLDGQTVPYTIKRSSRARYVRLEFKSGTGLTVVVPKLYRIELLPDVLKTKRRWILAGFAKFGDVKTPFAVRELKNGDTVPYLDRALELVERRTSGKTDSVELEQDRLVVSLGAASGTVNAVVEQWYRIQAAEVIKSKADKLSSRLGLTYKRIIIRGQKTRWGSCSNKGNLGFNWKLMMVPEPVLDYVIVHELTHLREMNHKKRFWELVAEQCPRWREYRKWLKDHQPELFA